MTAMSRMRRPSWLRTEPHLSLAQRVVRSSGAAMIGSLASRFVPLWALLSAASTRTMAAHYIVQMFCPDARALESLTDVITLADEKRG